MDLPSGVGKTVLLNNYSEAAETTGWVIADREWNQNDGDPGAFRHLVLEDLARLLLKLSVGERVKKRAEGLARALRGALSGLGISYEGVELKYDSREQQATPRRLDDELRTVLPNTEHRRHKGLNNRAENSHLPTRQRERRMQRFKILRAGATLPGTLQCSLQPIPPASPSPHSGRLPSDDE